MTVLDATDPTAVEMLARVPYDTASYTHQGWFTEDQAFFLLGDELDELTGEVAETTTYIFIKDKIAYESNYTSGLRMFDTYKLDQGRMKEVGWFDGFPADDEAHFAGTWSNYPWFESGNVVFTGTEEGLFVVRPRVKSSAP